MFDTSEFQTVSGKKFPDFQGPLPLSPLPFLIPDILNHEADRLNQRTAFHKRKAKAISSLNVTKCVAKNIAKHSTTR
jgi:hypothetical protein